MSREGRRRSLLGVVAYLAVPGERRTRAAGHFRRAGFEALRGFAALASPGRASEERVRGGTGGERERIEIE